MPRRAGAKNYKNDVLIAIIEEVLPNGELGWDAVALAYQEQTSEETKRDTDDLKRYWIRNLCKGMKKPTGQHRNRAENYGEDVLRARGNPP